MTIYSLVVLFSWQNVVHWRRERQTTPAFLPWEPHEQYEKTKINIKYIYIYILKSLKKKKNLAWKVKVKSLSRVWLFATPWTEAYQAPPSMGFPRQEYWSGLPFPSPGDLPNPGSNLSLLGCRQMLLLSEPPGKSETGAIFKEKGKMTQKAKL